jgi:hypothetical protein
MESLQDIALLKLQELIQVLERLQALLLKPESVQDIALLKLQELIQVLERLQALLLKL